MHSAGSYFAKTHLPELIRQVEAGEHILITRNGHPVARLVPARGPVRKPVYHTIRELFEMNFRRSIGPELTARDLINGEQP
jgi:antitoxin (DNA-binding transcriptional repressor) of toxin-antitoxin stability system